MRAMFTSMFLFITTLFNGCNEFALGFESIAKVAHSSADSLLAEETTNSEIKQVQLEAKLAATIAALDTEV